MKNIVVLNGLEGNEPTHLYGMQKILAPYAHNIEIFWWIVWVSTLAIIIFKMIKHWLNEKNDVKCNN